MNAFDADRLSRLERRVADLEARLATSAGTAAVVDPPAPSSPPADAASLGMPVVVGAGPRPPVGPVAAPEAPAAAASRSFSDLEEQLSSRLLAWVGGIALVLGAMFFLSLAFSRGWIGPEARVVIGLVAGAAALMGGAWLFGRGDRTPALVLAGVGVGTESLALFAASRLYGFIPAEAALGGFLLLAIGTAGIALRGNSQAVATFGLVATMAAPPILGASPNLVTIAFLGAALIGTALIGFGRAWSLLALIAFLLTAPQAARWFLDEPSLNLVILGIAAFWGINALAAAGTALANLRPIGHRSSATLLAANALFAIWSLHTVLADPAWRMAGLLVLAALHGALALPLLSRPSGRHPFGVVAAGMAAGTVAIGIAIELEGVFVPIGHAVLATTIAWVGLRFRERSAAAWAAAIGSLALLHLVAFDYPLGSFDRQRDGWPFTSPEAIAAVVVAAALLLTGILAWRSFTAKPSRSPLWTPALALAAGCIGAVSVIAYAAVFELGPEPRIVAWASLAIASLATAAFVRHDRLAWQAAAAAGAVLIAAGSVLAFTAVEPPTRLLVDPRRTGGILPLLNDESLAVASLAVALLATGRVVARWSPRDLFGGGASAAAVAPVIGAAALAVYMLSIAVIDVFQTRLGPGVSSEEIATQAQVALSIVWVLIGAVAFATGLVRGVAPVRAFGLGLLAIATIKVFLFDLASLDVSYRVLSFLGLGGVLLASSFVAARFRAPRAS